MTQELHSLPASGDAAEQNGFLAFDLPENLIHKLIAIGFDKPTPVQQQAIPLVLQGRDVLASAQTGTGKTGAFAIPMLAKILNDGNCHGLIITPTRELAAQVHDHIRKFLGAKSKIRSAVVIGGASMQRQIKELAQSPRIIVGTPGRIIDHLERGTIDLSHSNYVVLDETDRMLDMGFAEPIAHIFGHVPKERQTLLFSATLPKNIQKLSASYLKNHEYIKTDDVNSVSENIQQEHVFLNENEKFDRLVEVLGAHEDTAIVFMNSKFATEKLARRLEGAGISAAAIHGDLRQTKRERVIAGLRRSKFRVLVATDVAARGLDVPHIHQVINYNLPRAAEDYIHRIGRTGRNGKQGMALNLVGNDDRKALRDIQRLMDPNAPEQKSDKTAPRSNRRRRPEGAGKPSHFGPGKSRKRGQNSGANSGPNQGQKGSQNAGKGGPWRAKTSKPRPAGKGRNKVA